MTQVRLKPAALRSRVKHSTTEPLLKFNYNLSDKGIKKGLISGCIDVQAGLHLCCSYAPKSGFPYSINCILEALIFV